VASDAGIGKVNLALSGIAVSFVQRIVGILFKNALLEGTFQKGEKNLL
jgi:hypothetical protein